MMKYTVNNTPCICGMCGNGYYCDDNGNCGICNADNWVEPDDLSNDELFEYVNEACERLNITRSELERRIDLIKDMYHILPFEKIDQNKK